MCCVSMATLWRDWSSTRAEGNFFSVAITTPSVARMPMAVLPDATALSAYSIWISLPDGLVYPMVNVDAGAPRAAHLKVVKLKP